ncbi:MAG: hypothetical protein CSB46_05965 [Micrococcales bacterium]|nr:MAG: hypothetical protein CSB46_05965 [Micrococcales bacterium]
MSTTPGHNDEQAPGEIDPQLLAQLPGALARWMPAQRWFPRKGMDVRPHIVAARALATPVDPADPGDAGQVRSWLLAVGLAPAGQATEETLVQVPVTVRTHRTGDDTHLIGELAGSFVYDGPADGHPGAGPAVHRCLR